MYSTRLHAKFWSHVAKCQHGDACQACCWLWTAAQVRGYGHMLVRKKETGGQRKGMRRAHRIAWEITHGAIPQGLWVLHDCPGGDNPLCVNPAHVWLGTPDDNQKDSMRKGRRPTGAKHGLRVHPEAVRRGEDNPQATLTAEDVSAIRSSRQRGYPVWQIAEAYHISEGQVRHIVRRESWRHLPEREETNSTIRWPAGPAGHRNRGERNHNAKLTPDDVRAIRHAVAQGMRHLPLAERYGVSRSLISMIVIGKIWQHVPTEEA